jgi:serine/threonine protein kinase
VECDAIRNEIKIHRSLSHPNIIGFIDCAQIGPDVYILMELASYGCLFQYLDPKIGMPENLALRFFYQTVRGIEYMHKNKIMHRDIKPENLLLDETLNVKICDLGYSCYFDDMNPRSTICGTFFYYPPEMLEDQKHTLKVDIWCLGVLLYEMLHCQPPYFGLDLKDLYNSIKTRELDIREDLTPDCVDLLRRMLIIDPDSRISVEEVLNHPAISSRVEKFGEPVSEDDFKYLMNNYYQFKLKQVQTKTINEDIDKLVNDHKVVQVKVIKDNHDTALITVPVPPGIEQIENNYVSLTEGLKTDHYLKRQKRANSLSKLKILQKLESNPNDYPIKDWNSNNLMCEFLIRMALQSRTSIHPSGRMILLERKLNWQDHLFTLEKESGLEDQILFVIFFSRLHNLFIVEGIREPNSTGVYRKLLKKNFRGKSEKELTDETGIDGLAFCQKDGVLAGARNLFAAILIADLSL